MRFSWHGMKRGYVLQIHVDGFQIPDCMIDEHPTDCQRHKLFWNTRLKPRCRQTSSQGRFYVKWAHVKFKRMFGVLHVAFQRRKGIFIWEVVSRLVSVRSENTKQQNFTVAINVVSVNIHLLSVSDNTLLSRQNSTTYSGIF